MVKRHRSRKIKHLHALIFTAISAVLIVIGLGALWIATLKMPDLNSFENRVIAQSTKIYDRTGTILLYDTGTNAKRTTVPLSDISPLIPQATIAIEDSNFYNNIGIEPLSILRAVLADIASGGYDQGASTITQQVVKNSLLTTDKTITRKIKEWVLSVKLTRIMSKNEILETYLNETSYGGTIYGVEEASQEFFGKSAKDIDLAQAAYLAAIPQAPTHYSPYGQYKKDLDARQKLVLSRMKDLKMITDDQYQAALKENVVFLSKNSGNIRAPHFVMWVRDQLVNKYGEDMVDSGGLKVITTLDYDMQQKAESVVTKFAPTLETNFNASNTAMVALDPTNGDILTMIGSENYFDQSNDGNYNVTLAKRQPGSTFKPFIYVTDFEKGYTPETMLWDIPMEFSTLCNPDSTPKNPTDDPKKVCYSPGEYDNNFEGPISVRFALAQSRNLPAVQALYLAGIPNAINTAESMGVNGLDANRCGLTLVLGGCEASLLDMTSAYGVFANDGIRNPYRSILEVDDNQGNILEKATTNPTQVIPPENARQISDILSDKSVRMASLMPIGDSVGRTVAIKTGTTNDYRDVWTIGYTPNLVVGAWAGNNDNTPMEQKISSLIISPLWGAFMSQVAKNFPPAEFKAAPPPLTDNKPVLRGIWQGGVSYWIDSVSGKVATQFTPIETRQEKVFNDVHSILYWVNKDNPQGPAPINASTDSQYTNWEYAVRKWFQGYQLQHPDFKEVTNPVIPTVTDDIHTPDKAPKITIVSPTQNSLVNPNTLLTIQLQESGAYPVQKTEVYLNNKYVLTSQTNPLTISFVPADVSSLSATNTLMVILYDTVSNKSQASVNFSVGQ